MAFSDLFALNRQIPIYRKRRSRVDMSQSDADLQAAIQSGALDISNLEGYDPTTGEITQKRSPDITPGLGSVDIQEAQPEIVGYQNKPTKFRGFLENLPNILQSGIDAAATPNIAGGGGTDFFRALQHAGQTGMQRDILTESLRRQRRVDQLREIEEGRKITLDEERQRHNLEQERRMSGVAEVQAETGREAELNKTISRGGRFVTQAQVDAMIPEMRSRVRKVGGYQILEPTQEEVEAKGKVPYEPGVPGLPSRVMVPEAQIPALVGQINKPAPKVSAEDRIMHVAARTVADQLKIAVDPSKGDIIEQLPLEGQQQAIRLGEELKKTRNPELSALTSLMRVQKEMEIERLKQERGPDAIGGWVAMMKRDPDIYFDSALNEKGVRPLVAKAWEAETGLPVPRKLDPEMKKAETTSGIGLGHLEMVRDLLKDPVIQKRIGPILGRLGNLEQSIGVSGLSDADTEKIQKFRTALNYFFFREGRALLTGRPAEKLLEDFKATSANVKMVIPMIAGALDGAEVAAKNTLQQANNYRFGGGVFDLGRKGRTTETVRVIGPNGEERKGPAANIDAFLKANPGWRKK